MRCLMWFRADLRIQDNAALYHAARKASNGLIAIYIISIDTWQRHDVAACRVDFILRHLKTLSLALDKLNIPLLIYQQDKGTSTEQVILDIIHRYQINAVFYNHQYEIDEARRDLQVEAYLTKQKINVFSYHDQTIIAPGEITAGNGNYYKVFTPFKKTWIKTLSAIQQVKQYSAISKQIRLDVLPSIVPESIDVFKSNIPTELWPVGEAMAHKRLDNFIEKKITHYAAQRDFPALDATSRLSPYLSTGILSARQCLNAALHFNHYQYDTGELGASTWINELIWREFYKHILHTFPRVSMNKAFKPETENIPWDNNPECFAAWCEGRTGYPLVDAAMRQLKQTGWMHNRLRMITAMFLVKDLLVDWRWGEQFFMQHLIDGDLAANNGGWQWAASTGTDAVPYFRVFNPFSQSKRFDPQGTFIKQYCPELSGLDAKTIHQPHLLSISKHKSLNYPLPIVEHEQARIRVLAIFKSLSKKSRLKKS